MNVIPMLPDASRARMLELLARQFALEDEISRTEHCARARMETLRTELQVVKRELRQESGRRARAAVAVNVGGTMRSGT